MLIVALPVGVASVAAQTAPAISVGDEATASPGDTITAEPGETVTVTVWANASAVSGYQTKLTFDPSVVRVDEVSGSADFDAPVANIDNESGSVAFNQIRSADADDPVLAEITLTVVGEAGESAALSFDPSETKFATDGGQTFAPETYGDVTVSVEDAQTETDTETPASTTEEQTTEEQPTTTEEQTTTTEEQTPTTTEEQNTTTTEEQTPTTTEEPTTTESSPEQDDENDASDDDDDRSSGSSGGDYSAPAEPSLAIESVRVDATNATVGTPVTVSAVVENSGDADGEMDLRLGVDGNETGDEQTVEVGAGETRTVNFSVNFDSPGTYALAVNAVTAGNVTIAENASTTATETTTTTAQPTVSTAEPTATTASTATTDSTTTTGGSTPGFGFLVTLVSMTLLVGWRALGRDER